MNRVQQTILPFSEGHLGRAANLFVSVFGEELWQERWTEGAAKKRLAELLDAPGASV